MIWDAGVSGCSLSIASDWLWGAKKQAGINLVLEAWSFQKEWQSSSRSPNWDANRQGWGWGSPPGRDQWLQWAPFYLPTFYIVRRSNPIFLFSSWEKNKRDLQYRARVQRTINSLPPPVTFMTRWIVQIKWWQLTASWVRIILVQMSQLHYSSLLL